MKTLNALALTGALALSGCTQNPALNTQLKALDKDVANEYSLVDVNAGTNQTTYPTNLDERSMNLKNMRVEYMDLMGDGRLSAVVEYEGQKFLLRYDSYSRRAGLLPFEKHTSIQILTNIPPVKVEDEQ